MPPTALRPSERSFHGAVGLEMTGWICEAIIQDHHDVRAKCHLDINGALRTQEMQAAVQMRLEPDTVFTDVTQRTQTENLETSAVCQDRAVPPHEPVQATEPRHRLVSRPQK